MTSCLVGSVQAPFAQSLYETHSFLRDPELLQNLVDGLQLTQSVAIRLEPLFSQAYEASAIQDHRHDCMLFIILIFSLCVHICTIIIIYVCDTIFLSNINIIIIQFYIILCDYYDDVYAMILCMYTMFSMHNIRSTCAPDNIYNSYLHASNCMRCMVECTPITGR